MSELQPDKGEIKMRKIRKHTQGGERTLKTTGIMKTSITKGSIVNMVIKGINANHFFQNCLTEKGKGTC